MDIAEREWSVKVGDDIEGPMPEEEFQERLRDGEFPLHALIKSNFMSDWQPLLTVVSNDETFRRPSTLPPSPPHKIDEE